MLLSPHDWPGWLQDTCAENKWSHASGSPLIWRELLDRGGKGLYVGGLSQFEYYANHYHAVKPHTSASSEAKIASENLEIFISDKLEAERASMSVDVVRLCVTNALCTTAYQLIPLLGRGEVFRRKSLSLWLLDSPEHTSELEGLAMEIADLACPYLSEVHCTSCVKDAFSNASAAFILDCPHVHHREKEEEEAISSSHSLGEEEGRKAEGEREGERGGEEKGKEEEEEGEKELVLPLTDGAVDDVDVGATSSQGVDETTRQESEVGVGTASPTHPQPLPAAGDDAKPDGDAVRPPSQPEAEVSPPSKLEAEISPPQPPTEAEISPPQPQPEAKISPPQPQTEAEISPPQPQPEAEISPPQPQPEAEISPPQPQPEAEISPPQPQPEAEASPALQPEDKISPPQPEAEVSPPQPKVDVKPQLPSIITTDSQHSSTTAPESQARKPDAELLEAARVYVKYASTIDFCSQKDIKVLLCGKYAHIGIAVMAMVAQTITPGNFVGSSSLAEQKTKALIAKKLSLNGSDVKGVAVWGRSHGGNIVDTTACRVHRYQGPIVGPDSFSLPLGECVLDKQWMEEELPNLIESRSGYPHKGEASIVEAAALCSVMKEWWNSLREEEIDEGSKSERRIGEDGGSSRSVNDDDGDDNGERKEYRSLVLIQPGDGEGGEREAEGERKGEGGGGEREGEGEGEGGKGGDSERGCLPKGIGCSVPARCERGVWRAVDTSSESKISSSIVMERVRKMGEDMKSELDMVLSSLDLPHAQPQT